MDLSNSISDYANTVLLGLIIIYVGCALKKEVIFFLGCAVLKLLTCIGYCCTTNLFLLALNFVKKFRLINKKKASVW